MTIPDGTSETQSLTYFDRESGEWVDLRGSPRAVNGEGLTPISSASEKLKVALLTSLQMPNVVVFAGSGTSLGATGGPSMRDLWESCVMSSNDRTRVLPAAQLVIDTVGYERLADDDNIETLLSRCDAYNDLFPTKELSTFIVKSRATILRECSDFIDRDSPEQLTPHLTFLHRMSRRRVRDPRLKLFTTNYDLCFEIAASLQRLVVIDGFSFAEPRVFDPSYFQLDIVRRKEDHDEIGIPLAGVFTLYKIHGSVNWNRTCANAIRIEDNPDPKTAVLVYPASGKYRQSYTQPHLEMISRYLAALREPNTCVVVIGFGFKDSHLSQPILSAVRTNPHLRLLVVNSRARENAEAQQGSGEQVWGELLALAREGEDVWLINADFAQFAQIMPDLRALSPSQRLHREIQNIAGGGGGDDWAGR